MEKFSLDQPIDEKRGLATIKILDSFLSIRNFVVEDAMNWKISAQTLSPDLILYTYKKALNFIVNIHLGCIVGIAFSENYTGKLWNQIGIGDTIEDLLSIRNDVSFDEYTVLLDDNRSIYIDIDNDQCDIRSLESIKQNKITQISVIDWDLGIASLSFDRLPVEWEAYLKNKHK